MAHNLLMLGKMFATAALIATVLSSGGWSTDVAGEPDGLPSSGFWLGFDASVMTTPPDATVSVTSAVWGSVHLGWTFGDRFFHGPELEAGWWQFLDLTDDGGGGSPELLFHCGAGYRVGYDLLQGRTAALFISGGVSLGFIGIADAADEALRALYFKTDALLGARVLAGPIRVHFGLGPALGWYVETTFLSLQASVAVEL